MGLDMYLIGKKYLFMEDEKLKEDIKKLHPEMLGEAHSINFEEMYWRKANAIHKWFVDNVQEGNDNCGDYYVEKEKLQELLEIVIQISEDNQLAEELLPTQEGFFFGETEYDEHYFEMIEYTKKHLKEILDNWEKYKTTSFYYNSSW